MLNYFTFDGKDSRDFSILIKSKKSYNAPERLLNFQSIPGRDGDLVIDTGSYSNINMSYDILILADKAFDSNVDVVRATEKIKEWFYSKPGQYLELCDSYDPEYYRQAVFTGELEFEPDRNNYHYITSQIKFNCKPYRYRLNGNKTITVDENNTIITNFEKYNSLPLIRLYGINTSHFVINGYQYGFDFLGTGFNYVDIDSEKQIVYHGSVSYMNKYTPSSILFPELTAGNNTISFGGGTSKIEISPKWRTI